MRVKTYKSSPGVGLSFRVGEGHGLELGTTADPVGMPEVGRTLLSFLPALIGVLGEAWTKGAAPFLKACCWSLGRLGVHPGGCPFFVLLFLSVC